MKPSKRAQKMNDQLAARQAAGTHNPATQCDCGTMRTPGVTHTKGDTGLTPKGVGASQCDK